MQMRWAVQVLFVTRLGAATRFVHHGDIILDTSSDAQEEADAGQGPKTILHGKTFTCSKRNQCISGAHAEACVDKYSGDCKLYKKTPKDFDKCQREFKGGRYMKKIEPCMEDIVAAAGQKVGAVFPTSFNQQVRQILAKYCKAPDVGNEGVCDSAHQERWLNDYCVGACSSFERTFDSLVIKYSGSDEDLKWAQQQEDTSYADLKELQAQFQARKHLIESYEVQEIKAGLEAGNELMDRFQSSRWRAFWDMDKNKCMEICKTTPHGETGSWSDETWTFNVAGLPLAASI